MDSRRCRGKIKPSIATVAAILSNRMCSSVRYLTFTKKIFSIGGLWHAQTRRERLLRYYGIGFMTLYTVFGELCQLVTSNIDLYSIVRVLQICTPTVCGLAEYYNAVLHYNVIQKIYSYVLNDWRRLKDDAELKIMQQYCYYGNLVTIAGAVMFYTYIIVSISTPLLRIILSTNEIRSDLDLYPIISCFDYFSNRETYYYPIIIYQITTSFLLVTVSIASYSEYFSFILHACARLSIIKYKIYSPFVRDNHKDDVPITPTDLSPWIIDIVQRLGETTKFMSLVNRVFEKSYLFQIALAFVLLILDYLCIPVLLERKVVLKDMLGFSIYISGTLSMIYANCYIGQRLIDFSTDVYREVCLVPFHEMSIKTQKLLLTTLTMCAKPYTVSIGKVYVASHEFFSNLLRSSLSFAMVIHSIQNV